MRLAFKSLSQEEIDQSVLEVLSYRHSLEDMSREGMFRSLFQHLDKDASVRWPASSALLFAKHPTRKQTLPPRAA
jgi:hypothetical protein